MAKRNALMEWLDQTKKLAKAQDYAALDLVDRIFDILFYLNPAVLKRHREFIDDVCRRYHKPNPLNHVGSRSQMERAYREKNGTPIQKVLADRLYRQHGKKKLAGCAGQMDWKSCTVSRFGIDLLSKIVDSDLSRAETGQKDILWQWFEIIDFMFERPELVNPEIIDDYVTERIATVCRKHRKNNPLADGMRARFGKFWKSPDGRWRRERRHRI